MNHPVARKQQRWLMTSWLSRSRVAAGLTGCLLGGALSENAEALMSPPAQTAAVTVLRPRIDLTRMVKKTRVVPRPLITPQMAENIGPGSHLIIEIPGEGTFGCTANFVWESGTTRYLGAAGHCFIPSLATATHGPGADYNPAGVRVNVCVSNCSFGGLTGFVLEGDLVALGAVAYARQRAADGDIGNDFGIVTIPSSFASLIRPSMPVFGGPHAIENVQQLQPVCHYGNGVLVGETFLTMARVGIGGGSTPTYWVADSLAAPGDSGSALVTCESDGAAFHGRGAAGVVTHLGLEVCPCTINVDTTTVTVQQGFVFGTTIARAIEMAQEAQIVLALVFP
jgi:hypothetical protein